MTCNRLLHIANLLLHRLHFALVTAAERVLWRLSGVKMGEGVRFSGWCRLYRYEGSRINVGRGTHFVSSAFISHLGITHPSIIATETPEATLTIGDGCGFSGVSIVAFRAITIGNNVRVGAGTKIMDGDFHTDDPRTGDSKPVVIDDAVWLGSDVTVLKGVHIGRGSVIAAGSIVTHDIPAGVVAGGCPCRVIKTL